MSPTAASRWLLLLLALLTLPAQAATYASTSIAPAWIDPASHTRLTASSAPIAFRTLGNCATAVPITDDTLSDLIPLGFTFRFGDRLVDRVRIMSNGRLEFSNGNAVNGPLFDNTACAFGTPDPYPLPNAAIAYTMKVYGADLDPTNKEDAPTYATRCSTTGTGVGTYGNLPCFVSFATIGVSGNLSFVATWNNIPQWTSGSTPQGNYQLQIIVQQNGAFIYQYGTNDSTNVQQLGWQANASLGDYAVPNLSPLPPQNTAIEFSDPSPLAIVVTGGTPQSTSVGSAFTSALRATVLDTTGAAVSGATVTFTLPASGASGAFPGNVTIAAATTDSSGVATSPTLTANTMPGGPYIATAGVSGAATVAGFALTNTTGPPAKLAFGQVPVNTSAGQAIAPPVTVRVLDAYGNPTASSAAVTVAIGTNPAAGTLSGTVTVNAVNGIATFSTLTIDKAGSGYTLSASSAGLGGATSPAFDIAAGAPAQLAFAQQPTAAIAGQSIVPAVSVSILDAQGNVTASTAAVTLAIGSNPGGATLSGVTTVNAINGIATVGGLSLDKAGAGYTLTASGAGVIGATSTAFDVAAGPATQLAFVQEPTPTAGGQAIAPAVTVRLLDAQGNFTASTAAVTLAIGSNPGGATLSGVTSVNAINGIATFGGLSLDKTGSGYTLNASSAGTSGVVSVAFNIIAGIPASIVPIGGASQAAPIGTAFALPLRARVTDAGGNPLPGTTVTFSLPASGPSGVFSGGVATITAATDATGVAVSPIITANTIVGGPYAASATVSGVAASASFALTNAAPLSADLAVTVAAAPLRYGPGTPFAVSVAIVNKGPSDITGARIVVTPPPALQRVAWSCTASGGSSCGTTIAGTGSIDIITGSLLAGPANGLAITLVGIVQHGTTGVLAVAVQVSVPAGAFDPVLADNQASINAYSAPTIIPALSAWSLALLGLLLLAVARSALTGSES